MKSTAKGSALAAPVAAVLAAATALSCCLPLAPILAAVGFAGAAAWFEPAQPLLMGGAVLLLVFGFVQAYRAPACPARRRIGSLVLLWAAAVAVVAMLLFPQWVAAFLADALPRPASQ